MNPLTPYSDLNLISPWTNFKAIRMKEMITN